MILVCEGIVAFNTETLIFNVNFRASMYLFECIHIH